MVSSTQPERSHEGRRFGGAKPLAGRVPRLLILSSTYPRWSGDPEPGFVHELAKRLTGQFDVCVLCPHSSMAALRECLDGVEVVRYRYAPNKLETLVNNGGILGNLKRSAWKAALVPSFILCQWLALRRLSKRWRPDVVHAHWMVPQGIIAAVAHMRPLVVTSHGADLFALKGRMFSWLRAKVVKRAVAVTVVSDAMRDRLQFELPGIQVHTMPMGVDLEGRFNTDLQVDRSKNKILFVGRLVEKKGAIYLIEAMPRVLAACPDACLEVVGFGPDRDRLMERAAQLGLTHAVRFIGAVSQPDLVAYYRKAAVFVAPFIEASDGDQEGLGLVVAEALGCHCPVIVGDVVAVRDLIGNVADCVVPQRDAATLADAITRVLNDPESAVRQAQKLRTRLLERFSWEAVAKRYSELLSSVTTVGPSTYE